LSGKNKKGRLLIGTVFLLCLLVFPKNHEAGSRQNIAAAAVDRVKHGLLVVFPADFAWRSPLLFPINIR